MKKINIKKWNVISIKKASKVKGGGNDQVVEEITCVAEDLKRM